MKTSKTLLGALLLSLAAVTADAQVNDTYVIPAAANASGGFGTRWMTRFSVFNPHLDHALVVSITYLPTLGLPGIEMLIDLPPNSIFFSDNVLDDVFDISNGTGSLLVATFPEDNPNVPDNILSRSFVVTSDTYNNDPDGTFGQTIPGIWTGLLDYTSDFSAVAQGIRNSGLWRTNVGAVNLGRCKVTVFLNVYDANGNTIRRDIPFEVPPLGHFQQGLPVSVTRGTIEFFVEDPCAGDDDRFAVVFPYTSTIDNESGDPTYQSPAILASASDLFFAKGKQIDPAAAGRKIDSSYARGVRESAERRGFARLTKSDEGWQITK